MTDDADGTDGTGGTTGAPADRDSDRRVDGAADRRVPFAALAADAEERERRRGDAPDPFEEMDVPEFDGDVWAALADDGAAAPSDDPLDGGSDGLTDPPDDEATRADGADDDRPAHVVNKREYCRRCPHLADPPVLSCTHEGTDIAEVLDGDELRVRGCPMVDAADGPGAGGPR